MARWQYWTTALALGVALSSAPASAQSSQFYVAFSGGTATYFDQNNLEYDYFGYVVAAQAGFRMSPELRLEGEFAYESTSAEIDNTNIDVDVEAYRLSGTVYYDFTSLSTGGLLPFAGVGLGITSLEANNNVSDDTELSANLDGGASMPLGGNLDLVPMARWELTDDASNFQLRLGARLWF